MKRAMRPAPIHAFVGFNGGGKTLAAVELGALPALAAGRSVVANFPIEGEGARLLESWREIPTLRNTVLILDEVTAALPSRQSTSLPAELARVLNQLRKVDVEVIWTGPSWARADKMLREVTKAVTVCRGFWPARANGSSWPANRLFRWKTYAADDFDEFTFSAQKKLRAKSSCWYVRERHDAHLRYDTLAAVELLDHLDFTGVCPNCDGSRRRHVCKCVRSKDVVLLDALEAEFAE